MILGQIIRLEALAKRIVNCQIIYSTIAIIKNNGETRFLTFTVSSGSSDEEKEVFSKVSVGAVICAHGLASMPDSMHTFSTARNIQILSADTVDPKVFKPVAVNYTPFSKIRRDNAAESMVLLVKHVSSSKKYCVYCVDLQERYFRLILCSKNHLIKALDLIIVTDLVVQLSGHARLYAQSISTVEINPKLTDKRIEKVRAIISLETISVVAMDEINRITRDTSISMEGRLFEIQEKKNTVVIANRYGGIQVKIETDALSRLISAILRTYHYEEPEELYDNLVFIRVRLTADIILLNNQYTTQNISIAPLQED